MFLCEYVFTYTIAQTTKALEDAAVTEAIAAAKAEVLKSVAHPTRVLILEALAEGELSAGEVAEKVGAERTSVSKHLACMSETGVLGRRREGLKVYYHVAIP